MLVDSNLPIERDRLKNRLIRLVKEDDEILGCFFGGSIGSKTEDFYSDIDARIIVKKGVEFKRKQQEVIRSIGEYLFIESFEEDFSVIHYATFIKLDLFIYTESLLQPSIWLKEIEIVKDTNNCLFLLEEESQNITYKTSQEEFDRILNKYYSYYFELYRCIKRGEDNYAEFLTLAMKQSLVSMWYASKGYHPNQAFEWSKYEGEKSRLSHLEAEFLRSCTPCKKDEIESFTKKIEILMFEASEKVATYDDLDFSRKTFKKVHNRISFKFETN